jgi:hypothetical protein
LLDWAEPFLIYDAHKADEEALQAAGEHYVARLGRLAARPMSASASA